MKINFVKMHGLGNDFVIINNVDNTLPVSRIPISKLSNRHFGVGFDQLIVIEPGHHADFSCRIFNADGSEAEQCGNGLRCVARWLFDSGLVKSTHFTLATIAGSFPVAILNQEVEIKLGLPSVKDTAFTCDMINPTVNATLIDMGNPHAIINTKNIRDIAVTDIGALISARFSKGINVGFMQIIDKNTIALRTYERGIGETYACGSNACAAVATGISLGLLNNNVSVNFKYGNLHITWPLPNEPMLMRGETNYVFEGILTLS